MKVKQPAARSADRLPQTFLLNVHMKCVQQKTYIITSNLIQKFHPLVNCVQKIRLKTVQGFKGQPDSFCGGIARKSPEIIHRIGSLPRPFFL